MSEWKDFEDELVSVIDVKAVCTEWGIRFASDQPNDKGWVPCHAFDRDDKTASCGVNDITGVYHDFGGGPSLNLFQLGVRVGAYSSYEQCVEDLARQYKMLSKKPKNRKNQNFFSRIRHAEWNDIQVRGLCKKLDIEASTLREVGCTLGVYGGDDTVVVVFPVMEAGNLHGKQQGHVIRSANGLKHRRYRGKISGRDHYEEAMNTNHGKSGMMNMWAARNWKDVEFIWKVEGISDMLALHDIIPDEYKQKHAVMTNSAGASERDVPAQFATTLEGKKIAIVHDHDEPGQFGNTESRDGGARFWVSECSKFATATANIELFPGEPLEPKKGKDLRDWIAAGGTYDQLMAIARQSTWVMQDASRQGEVLNLDDEHEALMKLLKMSVIGCTPDGHVMVFSHELKQSYLIKDLNRFSYLDLICHIGTHCAEHVFEEWDKEMPEEMVSIQDVRKSIAHKSSGKVVKPDTTIGVGMWSIDDNCVVVGFGEWAKVGAGNAIFGESPALGEKIIDYGGKVEWYDREQLSENLNLARSATWCKEHFEELSKLFSHWPNIQHPRHETVMAALVLASFGQSMWDWRPWVSIAGESGSGKTTLMVFLRRYFGEIAFMVGSTTEAALRAKMRHHSKIAILDEFERNPHRGKILDLLKGSGRTGSDASSMRATSGQELIEFSLNIIPWFAGVETKMDSQTEANRYIQIELGQLQGKKRGGLDWIQDLAPRMRNESIAFVAQNWRRIRALQSLLIAAGTSSQNSASRQNESYALVSAVYGAAMGMNDDEVMTWHDGFMAELDTSEVVEEMDSDQELLQGAIFSSHMNMGGGVVHSVRELVSVTELQGAHRVMEASQALERFGMRVYQPHELTQLASWRKADENGEAQRDRYLFIATSKSAQVRRTLLRGTEAAHMNIRQVLKRIPGAFDHKAKMGGSAVRGVCIPLGEQDDKVVEGPQVEVDDDLLDL